MSRALHHRLQKLEARQRPPSYPGIVLHPPSLTEEEVEALRDPTRDTLFLPDQYETCEEWEAHAMEDEG